MGTSILEVRRAIAGAVENFMADTVTGAVLVAFPIFVTLSTLVSFAVCVYCCAVLMLLCVLLWQPLTLHISLDPEV